METKRWNIQRGTTINKQFISEAAALLKAGETVAFPTETVYGLGADATNKSAVAKIFEAKGRPQDNPLIAHVANVEQLQQLVDNLPEYVDDLIAAFSPGPLTYVLESNGACAENVTAGLSTIGVRIPDHPVALELLQACNFPVAAPSANLSGKPSPTTADHVDEDLNGKISGIVDGGPTGVGVESTVISCREHDVVILRPGGITKEQIEQIVPVAEPVNETVDKPASPGMKYKHYSPDVPLWLVDGDAEKIQNVIAEETEKGRKVALLARDAILELVEADLKLSLGSSLEDVANKLYDNLRKVKRTDVDIIISEVFPESGIGQAIMNRLKKAKTDYIP
ncbi:L-threonylcarbamoyladenylate synthase [Oceanobacillus indicireducens]|uniref:Threonylcarbamoyl-AMP synthase n=1 Tax=Oceanobacillus indicireducens TaxID=1004261 RepID=A0A917XSZ8_9BACI|nr:L-threonylcarbamoyladenylate synthase [Oceanobacillus indicireducens]GGN50233.1 threonylcarbamoyl-AMP synthase [Oceanobacillus indicireducens]